MQFLLDFHIKWEYNARTYLGGNVLALLLKPFMRSVPLIWLKIPWQENSLAIEMDPAIMTISLQLQLTMFFDLYAPIDYCWILISFLCTQPTVIWPNRLLNGSVVLCDEYIYDYISVLLQTEWWVDGKLEVTKYRIHYFHQGWVRAMPSILLYGLTLQLDAFCWINKLEKNRNYTWRC